MVISVKGDLLEGGGQILRIAVAMSALTGKEISIDNIRGKRKKPGLAAQHLNGVQLVQRLCRATLRGAALGSTSLSFNPHNLKGGLFTADTKTAGSVALLLQISLPCALFSDSNCSFTLKGGTHADLAPPIDYICQVLLPILRRIGVTLNCNIKKRGFFPAGQGEVICTSEPIKNLATVNILNFGELKKIKIEAYSAGLIAQPLADRIARTAADYLKDFCQNKLEQKVVRWSSEEAYGTGFGICIVGETTTGCIFGSSIVGNRDKSAEDVGRAAAEEIIDILKRRACVDQYMQDQLLIFMALSHGKSSIRTGPITLHSETAMHVIKQLCAAQFRVIKDGATNVIECIGIGLMNNYL